MQFGLMAMQVGEGWLCKLQAGNYAYTAVTSSQTKSLQILLVGL
jgi:hypothetical protein